MKNNLNPKMKYRVVTGRNPRTGEIAYRPVVADRQTMTADQVIEYALANGYAYGQAVYLRSVLSGIVEAMRSLVIEGKAVNLCDWFRVHGELTGTVDVSGALTKENGFRVAATPLKNAKCSIGDFNWEEVQ